jgi:Protein of unknown function (DUF3987)
LYRFLATYEPPTFFELNEESWEAEHQRELENLICRAMEWTEQEIETQGGRINNPRTMIFTKEAQKKFFDWRNDIFSQKDNLPPQLLGFLPKAVEYCLRLTGVVQAIWAFSQDQSPKIVLTVDDLDRGIEAIHFYLGQIQDALQLIADEDHVPLEISERSILLARTLESLRPHIDNGRLAIRFIQDQFNKIAPKAQRISSPRAMGPFLRAGCLTTTTGKI